jgi:hypothetical protein
MCFLCEMIALSSILLAKDYIYDIMKVQKRGENQTASGNVFMIIMNAFICLKVNLYSHLVIHFCLSYRLLPNKNSKNEETYERIILLNTKRESSVYL